MINHAELAINAIDECLDGYEPVTTLSALEDNVWSGLQESVKHSWRTPVEAQDLYFDFFKKQRLLQTHE